MGGSVYVLGFNDLAGFLRLQRRFAGAGPRLQFMPSNIRLNGASRSRRSLVDELSQRIRSSAAARVDFRSPSRVMTLAPFRPG